MAAYRKDGFLMRNNFAKKIALGGILAAVATVIMCLGGMIPLATFICPMLCTLTQYIVLRFCGKRIAWAWFGVVALLGALLGPDKEAALVFCLLGCYPMLKVWLEKSRLHWIWKILYFNGAILLLYGLLLRVLGLNMVMEEYAALGTVGLVVVIVLGNGCFLLLDRLLTILDKRKFSKK